MKIEYIGHASLLIETNGIKIVTDPWFNGASYCNQWHLFPKPVNAHKLLTDIDYVLITHGHEDHLHEASLKILPKRATVIYPYTWYSDSTVYFKGLGFNESFEALSWKTYTLKKGICITFISNNLDTIIVIESEGKVLVDMNDALTSSTEKAVEYFTEKIKQRWPIIDYVFSGFGGASYFPNTIHTPSKNDLEIAVLREQLFVNNYFCIVNNLMPAIAVPFASDFVLLDPENIWINNTKDSKKEIIEEYYTRFPDKTNVKMQEMYSGDILEDFELNKKSDFHKYTKQNYEELIKESYKDIIYEKENPITLNEEEAEKLIHEIYTQVNTRRSILGFYADKINEVHFDIKIKDLKEKSYYYVDMRKNTTCVTRNQNQTLGSIVEIQITSEALKYSFSGEWTGDVINIGYATNIFVPKEEYIENGYENVCIKLLTNHPNEDHYITKPSIRSFKFILNNPIHKDWFIKKLTRQKKKNLRENLYEDGKIYNRSLWLTKTKCEICKVCKMPDLESR